MSQSGQCSNLSEILSMSYLAASFRTFRPKLKWVMVMMTKSIRGFCSNQGNVNLSLMIQCGQILNLSEILLMPILSASLRRSDKKWMSYADDKFSNQGEVTQINSDQFSNLFEISSMSTFTSSSNIQSKLNELRWWKSQTEAFLAIKGM